MADKAELFLLGQAAQIAWGEELRIVRSVTQDKVWDHWFRIENYGCSKSLMGESLKRGIEDWRSDIKSPLPSDIRWHEAVIEQADVSHLFIISSDDWADISRRTFLLRSVAENLNDAFSNKDSLRISSDVQKKLSFLESGGTLDTKLVLVSDKVSGPFTVIEGNRRAVALLCLNKLVGTRIYLGISRGIRDYVWSRYAYRS